MSSDFADFPCGSNCAAGCEIRDKMCLLQNSLTTVISKKGVQKKQNKGSKSKAIPIQQSLFVPPEEEALQDRAAELVSTFMSSYLELCQSSTEVTESLHPKIALPALFDLVASAAYAERTISNDGWLYCSGEDLKNEQPALYFPFLRTCPRCSVNRGVKPSAKSNKPGSDTIGEIASNATILILTEVLSRIAPDAKIAKVSDRVGDVDAVIYNESTLALLEIKSSPLTLYPLEIKLTEEMTKLEDGELTSKREHSPATPVLNDSKITFYLPHINLRIPVKEYGISDWAYLSLTDYIRDDQNLFTLLNAWHEIYNVYITMRQQENEEGKRKSKKDIDLRRWILCGCGSPVDDTKNAPGMERTDDIKKGTYQVLKYGTYCKEKCRRRMIKSVLASNFLPFHGYVRYLSEMEHVLWTKDKYKVPLPEDIPLENVIAFRADSVFNLYDAILCLTRSIYRDKDLERLLDISKLVPKFFS